MDDIKNKKKNLEATIKTWIKVMDETNKQALIDFAEQSFKNRNNENKNYYPNSKFQGFTLLFIYVNL